MASKHYDATIENSSYVYAGKTLVITGTSPGSLGFHAARAAVKRGCKRVIMLNRKSSRAEESLAELKGEIANSDVRWVECDLMDFESVTKAAEEVIDMCKDSGIDVLCNNAGIMAFPDEANNAGYDVQMTVNHHSHFLLTRLLYPLLEKAAESKGEARVVNHSSLARNGDKLNEKYLGKNGGSLGGNGNSMFLNGARWQRYHQTKLANVIFTLALNDKLTAKNSKVKAVCAAPGLANSNLQVTTNKVDGMKSMWIMKYGQSAADGSLPLLMCCFGDDVESGDFIEPNKMMGGKGLPKKKNILKEKQCAHQPSRDMLWEASVSATGPFNL